MSFEFSGRMRDERPRSIFDVIKTKEIKVVSEKYFSLYGFSEFTGVYPLGYAAF